MLWHVLVKHFESVIRQMEWFLSSDWLTHRVFVLLKYPVHEKQICVSKQKDNLQFDSLQLMIYLSWSSLIMKLWCYFYFIFYREAQVSERRNWATRYLSMKITQFTKNPMQYYFPSGSEDVLFVAIWYSVIVEYFLVLEE